MTTILPNLPNPAESPRADSRANAAHGSTAKTIALIMAGVLAWGLFHAFGTSRGMVMRLPTTVAADSDAATKHSQTNPAFADVARQYEADGQLIIDERRLPANPLKGLIVVACSAGFLGFWAVMLWSRSRRIARLGR